MTGAEHASTDPAAAAGPGRREDPGGATGTSAPGRWTTRAVLAVALLAFAAVRARDLAQDPASQNLEASYHVLLTVRALEASPASRHHLLPTVTLGGENDRFIPWGATVPTAAGDFIYTSFPAAGFVAPYLAFGALRVDPTPRALLLFNLALHLAATLLLYRLVAGLVASAALSPAAARLGGSVAAAIHLLSREGLQAFGWTYWSQSLYEVFLVAALLAIARLRVPGWRPAPSRAAVLSLAAASFLGPFTEWTGFVFNGLAVALIAASWWRTRSRTDRDLALVIGAATACAGAAILLHFSSLLGWDPLRAALGARFGTRSAATGSWGALLRGYASSFGGLLLLAPALALIARRAGAGRALPREHARAWGLVLALASFAVVENAIVLQHATEFSYDRVKLAVPLALAAGLAVAVLAGRWRAIALAALAAALAQNVWTYGRENRAYAGWREVDRANRELRARVAEAVDLRCAALATNGPVRGYANLLFERGIYEGQEPAALAGLVRARRACAGVYLYAQPAFTDLPSFVAAYVVDASGARLLQPAAR